jgi:2-C-methyl-D-erythritol 4-phosphate cytidylyltransferase
MSASSGSYAVGVVLAAGLGTRVGADGNKAYLPLAGRSMVTWSLDAVTHAPGIMRTVLVFRRGERALAEDTVNRELPYATVEFVEGGDSRHASEFNVLAHLAADIESGSIDVVLIHDAARPMAGPDMFDTALSVAREFGGAIPALPIPDVVRTGPGGLESLSDRGTLVRVQTPQAFRAAPLLQAYRAADRGGFEGTDTSSCIERFTDVDVRTFDGHEHNLKVTYPHDIAVAERLLTNRPPVDM